MLPIKGQASLRKKRGNLTITKMPNHSSCRAQHETVALGKQSCTKMKYYMGKKFGNVSRNGTNMTSDIIYFLKSRYVRAAKSGEEFMINIQRPLGGGLRSDGRTEQSESSSEIS